MLEKQLFIDISIFFDKLGVDLGELLTLISILVAIFIFSAHRYFQEKEKLHKKIQIVISLHDELSLNQHNAFYLLEKACEEDGEVNFPIVNIKHDVIDNIFNVFPDIRTELVPKIMRVRDSLQAIASISEGYISNYCLLSSEKECLKRQSVMRDNVCKISKKTSISYTMTDEGIRLIRSGTLVDLKKDLYQYVSELKRKKYFNLIPYKIEAEIQK